MAKTNPGNTTAKANQEAVAKAKAEAEAKAKAAAEAQAKAKAEAEAKAKAEAEAQALAEATKASGKVPALRVTSARDGFRRGGRAWNKGENIVPVSELTEEQIAQIKGEGKLAVEEIEIDGEAAAE